MQKILYIYHTSSIGGGSYCLLNILKEIDRSQFEPTVMLASNGPLVGEITRLGIKVYIYPHIYSVPYNSSIFRPKRILNMFKLILNYSTYKRMIREINPDIIYVNSMMLYPYLVVKKKQGCKAIIHIREHWSKSEHRIQRRLAEHFMNKYADSVIAINKFSASMYDTLKSKTTVVYDWIDIDSRNQAFSMGDVWGDTANKFTIFLYTGGFNPIKGAREVVESFMLINDPSVRLLILGLPTKESYTGIRRFKKLLMDIRHKKSYQDEVCDLINGDNRIKCIPATYNIKPILEQSSCMLSYFTIPHANLAMAECIIAGTPVIAVDTEESREYANYGTAALLSEFGNIEAFRANIYYYLAHKDAVSANCVESSSVIAQLFDRVRNAETLNRIYKSL